MVYVIEVKTQRREVVDIFLCSSSLLIAMHCERNKQNVVTEKGGIPVKGQ